MILIFKGGAGSGDFGHRGRHGKVGGSAPSVRRFPFPASLSEPLSLWRDTAALKADPDYWTAKGGDGISATRLIRRIAVPLVRLARGRLLAGSIYVAPHAEEAAGDNAIPVVLAGVLARITNGQADTEIVQRNRVFHTGADPMERLNAKADFAGRVEKGRRYILTDDVMTMGGTLAELAHYIQANGGIVAGVLVLVNASRSNRLVADKKLTTKLEERFGDAIRELFRVDPAALTAEEAQYLIGFRTADELRNRSLKARQETSRRLGARGV